MTVLTPHAEGVAESWEVDGVSVRSFRYAPQRLEVLGYSRSLQSDETVRPVAGLVAPLYALAARRAVKRELGRRAYHLLHAHWVVPNGLVATPFCRRLPVGAGLHGSDVFMAEKPVVRSLVGRFLRRSRFLTGCSPELVDRVCRLGFPREQARVIPYGVDHETFTPDLPESTGWRQRLGVPLDAPLWLTVGRMVTKKGIQVLFEVLPELLERWPDLHLVLAGGGDRLPEFQSRAAAYRDRIHFPGAVLRDALPDLYRAADGFVLPAVHDAKGNVDGLPNVILEALASGLPVVASGISGIPLAITDGEQGRLVPEGDSATLLEALDELVGDPERARALGRAARERAVRELSWDAVAARYRSAYEEAVGRRRAERAS